MAELEQVLDRTRKEHTTERVFLIDQQDLFLVKLLDEQELELKQRDGDLDTLRRRLAELERRGPGSLPPPLVPLASAPPAPVPLVVLDQPPESLSSEQERAERAELERTAQKLAEDRERARETVARLQAQRDEAQNAVARIARERDDALYEIHRLRSELGGPRIPLSTRPPSAETRAPSSSSSGSSPIASTRGDAQDVQPISSILSPPRGNPHSSPIPSRLSPPPARLSPRASPPPPPASLPPEELRRALTGPSSVQPSPPTSPSSVQPSPDSRSALKQKPDANTRPLVGYSLGTGSVEPEHLSQPPPMPPKGSAQR
jgi:hypothetical protein